MFKTSYNYVSGRKYQIRTGKLVTQPNQSLTIKQIVDRYTGGVEVRSSDPRYDVPWDMSDDDAMEAFALDDNPDSLTALSEAKKASEDAIEVKTLANMQKMQDKKNALIQKAILTNLVRAGETPPEKTS